MGEKQVEEVNIPSDGSSFHKGNEGSLPIVEFLAVIPVCPVLLTLFTN